MPALAPGLPDAVPTLGLHLLDAGDEGIEPSRGLWLQEQVPVVGHQAERQEPGIAAATGVPVEPQEEVVFVGDLKDGGPHVPAVVHVVDGPGVDGAGGSWHTP